MKFWRKQDILTNIDQKSIYPKLSIFQWLTQNCFFNDANMQWMKAIIFIPHAEDAIIIEKKYRLENLLP